MWMIDPKYLCDSHLLTEHRDCHRILGAINAGRNLAGYVGKIEPRNLAFRHDVVVSEIQRRYLEPEPHKSPLVYYTESTFGAIVPSESCEDLRKCAECRWQLETWSKDVKDIQD